MGTEIQFESNLSAHFQMRDLNEDSNGYCWPVFYGDKSLSNGHYQNGVLPRATAEAYLGYDREIVRQTMIKHETIFKNQVFELHRLYRIQRDLMDDIRRRELNLSQLPIDTSLTTTPLASQVTCEGARKWYIANSPIASTSQARPSLSNTGHIHSPMSSWRGDTTQAAAFPSPNRLKTSEVLESKPSKFRRTFDLQLPANEYIDSDEQEQAKATPADMSKFRGLEYGKGNGIHLSHGRERVQECSSRSRELADLNQPILIEETSTSHSDTHDTSAKPRSLLLGLPHENSGKSHRSSEQQGKNWLPHVLEAGDSKGKRPFPDGGWPEKYTSLQSMHGLLNSAYVWANENKLENHRVERSVSDLRISESFKSPESVLGSQQPSQYQMSPKGWTKSCPKMMSSVQMHPCLDTTASCSKTSQSQSYGIFADKWDQRNAMSNSNSNPTFGNGLLYQNSFYCGSNEQSSPLDSVGYPGFGHRTAFENLTKSSEREVNLNLVPTMGSQEEITGKKDSLNTLPWLIRPKTSAIRRDLNFDWFPSKNESENNLMQRFSQDLNSVISSYGPETREIEDGECLSDRRISGSAVFERPARKSGPSSHNSPVRSEVEAGSERKMWPFDINLPCDPNPEEPTADVNENLVALKELVPKNASFRHEIDLNSCLSDDDESTMVVHEKKFVPIIDLEVPAVAENEDIFTEQVFEFETSINSLHRKTEDPTEEFIKEAAEAIVAISLASCHENLDQATCSSCENPIDVLDWFADTVLESGSKVAAAAYYESISGETDYFELMTLQLTETKPNDFLPEAFVPEIIDVDESAAATTVSNRPRRGQARRGRQKRDFQRDILPGLTSLSRHEVTEDLQTFDGMMRAMGHSWQSRLARRNSSRGGQGRGRRRAAVSSVTSAALVTTFPIPISIPAPTPSCTPLIQQLHHIEVGGLEERSLTSGWGKTLRRPRRQRCPNGNNPALLDFT